MHIDTHSFISPLPLLCRSRRPLLPLFYCILLYYNDHDHYHLTRLLYCHPPLISPNAPTLHRHNSNASSTQPPHRFWWVKLKALTETRDFEGLDAFARSRRSPIGYQPFVRHLVEKGHTKDAATFVPRCDANKRVDLYVECGEWRMAGKECKDRGDKAKMECVKS